MRRSAVVVILMQQNFDDIQYLYPINPDIDHFLSQQADEPFSEIVIDFLNALSNELLRDVYVRRYPDVVTFAFFCRKANLKRMKNAYDFDELRLGRGLIFHVAPSNVPVNFAYSLICGLLAGNFNIVRVPSKEFEQVRLIVDMIGRIVTKEEYQRVGNRIMLVRYPRDSFATDWFSSLCNVRIIWGGDATIEQIRKSRIPARAFDVTFADRYSFAIVQAAEYLKNADRKTMAEDFYNDTYLFDQNACSSPHFFVWLGEKDIVEKAKEYFWNELHDYVIGKYELASVIAVDKLTTFYRQAVNMSIEKEKIEDNYLWRVKLNELTNLIDNFRGTCGYFLEYMALSLNEILPIIKNNYQTMAYYGISEEELQKFILLNKPVGIDRIVPIGKTTDFSVIWDGYDLIRTLSRFVTVQNGY